MAVGLVQLLPVQRKSLTDHVFDQLAGQIMAGGLAAGGPLPAERELCELLQVSRTAVREAVRRLEQAGLVATQQGAQSRVLDYRRSGGLDLLPALLLGADGQIDLAVVRSVMELRSALAPDAARLAAQRRTATHCQLLRDLQLALHSMGELDSQEVLDELGRLGLELWDVLVDASGNIAYRLAFNSLRQVYDPVRPATDLLLAEELRDVSGCCALIDAVLSGQAAGAEEHAKVLIGRGLTALLAAIDALQPEAEAAQRA